MATRINRKNQNSTAPKEVAGVEKSSKTEDVCESTVGPTLSIRGSANSTSIGKRIYKSSSKTQKAAMKIKRRDKDKKTKKIEKKLRRRIIHNAKSSENRRKLLRNGLKDSKVTRLKTNVKKEKSDNPPTLEPVLVTKKQFTKRNKKAIDNSTQLLDVKKIKVESDDVSQTEAVSDSNVGTSNLKKNLKRQRGVKKIKNLNESIEDTISDFSFLIKKEEVKTEVDSMSESGKSDATTTKKFTRKQKIEPLEYITCENIENSTIVKKEDIKLEIDTISENEKLDVSKSKKYPKKQKLELSKKQILKKEHFDALEKNDEVNDKVIDVLDLNVGTIKRKVISKRRHSIEKIPMSSVANVDITISHLLNHLPRSISPRSKRHAKVRQSHDGFSRRSSPYSTRSDSPIRILRNGKQRKWIDLNLVEGLDNDMKKRRRLCSDLSGSEMSVSKLSGYESDSSFSDLVSSHEVSNIDIDLPVKSGSFKESFEESAIEMSTSVTENISCKKIEIVDTNSNVCNNINKVELKTENIDVTKESDSSVVKVPEKSVILDIMKQAFNEISGEKPSKISTQPMPTKVFYGKESDIPLIQSESSQNEDEKLENFTECTNGKSDDPNHTVSENNLNTEENDKVASNSGETNLEMIQDNEENYTTENFEVDLENILADIKDTDENEKETVTQPLEKICDLLKDEEHPPSTIYVQIANDNAVQNEESEQNAIFKDGLVSENNESSNEVAEDNEQTSENLNISRQFETVMIINDTNAIDNRIFPTSCSDETEKTELTDDNVANMTDITEEVVNKITCESSLEVTEKENILEALGLQSLRSAEEAKHKLKEKYPNRIDNYTGTLKTVIKLNRDKKKGGRVSSIKMTLQNSKHKIAVPDTPQLEKYTWQDPKEGTSKQEAATLSDTAGAHRKSHYSNRSNMDGSSEHTSDGEGTSQDGTIKALVIPEKASSFSIHPGRLCKDECSYCFGKFGLFDTPCHIAQMKSVDRQDKILATEKHLMRDSCLCDACYRHVDRKSNTPSYTNKSLKRNCLVAPGPKENHCHVLGCNKLSTNILRRKWIIKMKKSICQVINIDLDNPGLHSIPICDDHYSALEHLMICSMCKRRLARNHIHYLGPETNELNTALIRAGIPISLTDKPVVCKLCKCFASVILKDTEERTENSINFFNEYKRRLLHFNDILPMDESAAEEPISVPTKTDKLEQHRKKKKSCKNLSESDSQHSIENSDDRNEDQFSLDKNNHSKSRSESPIGEESVVDYNTLIPAIAMDCDSDSDSKKEDSTTQPVIIEKIIRNDKNQDAVEISKVYKSNSNKTKSDIAVQKLGSNPSISVRQLFPGEEDLPLDVHIDFNNVKDQTPEGWEKCSSVIQYDTETKKLWQELQKPYGNQSSFLRHLILLEKYFRNGDLVLSASATHLAINYSESVHNRLRAYDNISTSAKNIQPLSMIPFNKINEKYSTESFSCGSVSQNSSTNSSQRPIVTTAVINRIPVSNTSLAVTSHSSGHKITKSNPALTITQLNSPLLTSGSTVLQQIRTKMIGAPPGLISLQPGTSRPINPLVKIPQSQKIKFPITKNWRPNLIPIDATKKQERKAGLVQVISGGKPYHITLEDYKKMCAIKRSFEMKQKRQELQNAKPILVTHNSVLKSITPKKGLIISKASPVSLSVKSDLHTQSTDSFGENQKKLEKLNKYDDKQESKLNEKTSSLLPKIPKSLTVIPQNVPKPSRPSSPILEITQKNSSKT